MTSIPSPERDDDSYTLAVAITAPDWFAVLNRLAALEVEVAALQKRLDEAEGGK